MPRIVGMLLPFTLLQMRMVVFMKLVGDVADHGDGGDGTLES